MNSKQQWLKHLRAEYTQALKFARRAEDPESARKWWEAASKAHKRLESARKAYSR
jgi:hypothetical protein